MTDETEDRFEGMSLEDIRYGYQEVTGKKPFNGWDAPTLISKILAAEAEEAEKAARLAESIAQLDRNIADRQAAREAAAVEIMLLGNHVYLPEDPLTDKWETCATTKRYEGEVNGRRARLKVHPALAAFLQGRKQAEIL